MSRFFQRLALASLFNLVWLQCAQASWVCYTREGQTLIAAGARTHAEAKNEAFERCFRGSGNPRLCHLVECHPKYH